MRLVIDEFEASGTRFALVGGLAVSVRTEPRFTRDVDVAVAVPSDREAEALIRRLMDHGWKVLAQAEHEPTGRLATVRLSPPPSEQVAEGVVVDLLFASSGLEQELVAGAQTLEVFEGLAVPVATLAHLLALKILAHDERTRPQDRIDARALLTAAAPGDLEEARAALERIEERGFHRGKDLVTELDELIHSI
jgi:hypothetical protein